MSSEFRELRTMVQVAFECGDECKSEMYEVIMSEGDGSASMAMLVQETSYSRRSIRKHSSESDVMDRESSQGSTLVSVPSECIDEVSVAVRTLRSNSEEVFAGDAL